MVNPRTTFPSSGAIVTEAGMEGDRLERAAKCKGSQDASFFGLRSSKGGRRYDLRKGGCSTTCRFKGV